MKNIAAKLVCIMAECAYVQKSGNNDFHRYKYATAADVLEKVNTSLVKNRVAVISVPELLELRDVTNLKGNTEHLATIRTTLTLIDCESGESVSVVGIGSGQDVGDKAVMKAATASLKYAWMMTLNISTGDDPEADAGVDERNSGTHEEKVKQAQPEKANEICNDCGAPISAGVLKVSVSKYKRPLCMQCQRKNVA
ncbi:MAG: superfamily [Firmicutes bacterium]|nr:superfamily [Bacillota bacterium]